MVVIEIDLNKLKGKKQWFRKPTKKDKRIIGVSFFGLGFTGMLFGACGGDWKKFLLAICIIIGAMVAFWILWKMMTWILDEGADDE